MTSLPNTPIQPARSRSTRDATLLAQPLYVGIDVAKQSVEGRWAVICRLLHSATTAQAHMHRKRLRTETVALVVMEATGGEHHGLRAARREATP